MRSNKKKKTSTPSIHSHHNNAYDYSTFHDTEEEETIRASLLLKEGSLHAPNQSFSHEDDELGLEGPPPGCIALWKEELAESGIGGKIVMIVSLPVYVCQRLTIPLVSDNEWSKWACLAACLCAPLGIAFGEEIWEKPVGAIDLWVLALIAGVVLFAVVAFLTRSDRPPKYRLPFALAGFVMSIVWVFTIAEELVAAAAAIGDVLGVSDVILGITILAWGNSVGDLMADVALARQGQTAMALTGCFAGCTFNLLVGMGLSLLLTTIRTYPEPYVLSVKIDFPIAIGFLTCSILFSLVYLWLTSFRIAITYGVLLYLIFLAFMTISLLLQLGAIFDPDISWS